MEILLKDYNKENVNLYIDYIKQLKNAKKQNKETKDWEYKNEWIIKKKDEELANYFKIVDKEGLFIDGKHITLTSKGITFDYIAYKNKMLLTYPESKIVFSEVYKDDIFNFSDDNGVITYSHKFANPFNKNIKNIIGLYCIIKNRRGDFITFLTVDEIEKHRKIATTDHIWHNWYLEMCYKTIIKKASKVHFDDVFTTLNEEDNKTINLENPLNIDIDIKQKIEEIDNIEDLKKFYEDNKNIRQDKSGFNKLISIRKRELTNANN